MSTSPPRSILNSQTKMRMGRAGGNTRRPDSSVAFSVRDDFHIQRKTKATATMTSTWRRSSMDMIFLEVVFLGSGFDEKIQRVQRRNTESEFSRPAHNFKART